MRNRVDFQVVLPALAEDDYLKEFYGGSFLEFVVALTKTNKLSEEDAKKLVQIGQRAWDGNQVLPKKGKA